MKLAGRELFSLSDQEMKMGHFELNCLVTVHLLNQQFLRTYSSCEKPEEHLARPLHSLAQLEFTMFFFDQIMITFSKSMYCNLPLLCTPWEDLLRGDLAVNASMVQYQ